MDNIIQFKSVIRANHQQKRQARCARQLDILGQILEIPEENQADALYDVWPIKLPKVVRGRIGSALRQKWRKIRADEMTTFEATNTLAFSEALGHPLDLDEFLDLLPQHRVDTAVAEHEKVAGDLLRTLKACATIRCVTVNWNNQSFVLDYPDQAIMDDVNLLRFLCLMVGTSGSVVLREESRLRAQVKTSQGMTWVPQERIYGFFCGFGGWVPQSAADMREAYLTNSQTGERLPIDPATTMGDARELVKKAGVRATPPQSN